MGAKLLCLNCGAWFDENRSACPGCGDQRGVPASSEDVVAVSVTWHELRVLVMWAEKFADAAKKAGRDDGTMLRVVYGIADRLYSQHLDKPHLTMAGEIAEVKAAFGEGNVETHGIPGHPDADAE